MAYIDPDNLRSVLLDDDALSARKLTRQRVGSLRVTSGLIVACDPLIQPDRPAFAQRISARGMCDVEVLQANGREALAVLWLGQRARCASGDLRWEPALLAGQAPPPGEDEFVGYPVDTGLGCFMDADATLALAAREKRHADDPDFNYYDSVLAEEMGDDHVIDHHPLGQGSANNVVIFRSGYGDGVYPSYWAFDTQGEPVALVTDFMVIKGGDARSDEDRRAEAYRASLSPDRHAQLEALSEAVERGDGERIRELLARGEPGANEIIPSSGETAIASAIRLNQTEALRVLLADKPCPAMPEELHGKKWHTYLEYARCLKKPRDPALIALLEQHSNR